MEQAIEIRDLRVDYGDFTAVSNLSLTIGKGEIYGLVGPNGAGKTSTLNVLATLLVPTYGSVSMAGFDLDQDPDEIRARLGYMPDLAPVVSNLQVWEFLDLFAASYGLDSSQRKARINECLELVKMEESRKTLCGTLSRGMTQRVVLAKTLLHKPDILLLDEPASGMDPIARIDLKDALQSVSATGSTIIISSHILSELSEMATSVGILHKGRLRAHGDVHEVLSSLEHTSARIQIELVENREGCLEWMHSRNLKAQLADKHPHRVELELEGGQSEQAALLKDLIQAGFSIHGFQARNSSLEDLMRSISSESEEEANV